MSLLDKTLFCNGIQNWDSVTHFIDKILSDGFIYRYYILLFVLVSSAKNFIDYFTIVG